MCGHGEGDKAGSMARARFFAYIGPALSVCGSFMNTLAVVDTSPIPIERSRAMSTPSGVSINFWGVHGSVACSAPDTVLYGGNTACVEVLCDDRRAILDAGTGIRPLGASLAPGTPLDADILLSHMHLDHLVGLPFFAPAYTPGSYLRL